MEDDGKKRECFTLFLSIFSFLSLSLERKVCRRPKIIPVGGSLKIFSTRDLVERSTKKNIIISMIWRRRCSVKYFSFDCALIMQ